MNRREELLAWIDETKRLQRRLGRIFAAIGVVTVALMFWRFNIGVFATVCLALVAICSFWVTEAHNAAHRQTLDQLARVERNNGKPLQTAHRRWHARD